MKELGIVEFCEQLKAEGKIRYLGFSFHDTYEAFEEVLRGRDWDFCQIQYNYMDTEEQAGDKGYSFGRRAWNSAGDHGACKGRQPCKLL